MTRRRQSRIFDRLPPRPRPAEDATLFDALDAARERGHEGTRRAAGKADRVEPGWRAQAVEAVRVYSETHEKFMSEHLRRSLVIPEGADARALGHVLKEAQRLGYIAPAGYAPAASSNGSPKCVWRSLIYGRKSA